MGPASGRSVPVSRGPVSLPVSPGPVSPPLPVSIAGVSMGDPVSVPASTGLTAGSVPQAPSEALDEAVTWLRKQDPVSAEWLTSVVGNARERASVRGGGAAPGGGPSRILP